MKRAAIESIAARIGCTPETPPRWGRRGERDTEGREGSTTAEQQRVKELEREVRCLRRASDILKPARAYFAQVKLNRRDRHGGRCVYRQEGKLVELPLSTERLRRKKLWPPVSLERDQSTIHRT